MQPQTRPAHSTPLSLSPELEQLLELSDYLYQREQRLDSNLKDYSFILFPLAKAYEGFLKDFLLSLGLIDERLYRSRRFRIGRALNPDLRPSQQDEIWLYDNIEHLYGRKFAQEIWQTWLLCRNHVFHFFPDQVNFLTLTKVGSYREMVKSVIKQAREYQQIHTRSALTR